MRAQLGAIPAAHTVRATVEAPAAIVREQLGHYGTVEPRGSGSSEVTIATESLDWAVFSLTAIGVPFVVHGSSEAIDHFR